MIASLMMYRRPELEAAIAVYWRAISSELGKRGIDSPTHLSQDADPMAVWTDPNLVLSQTCGRPYRMMLHERVTLIGTPDYGLPECPPGHYRSAWLVRREDPRGALQDFQGASFAYNERLSQSGYAAAFNDLQPQGWWFDHQMETGSHWASAHAVAVGQADIAAIDAVTWHLIERFDPFADRLKVLAWTEPTPGLPYIAAKGADKLLIFDAVSAAIARLPVSVRDSLGVRTLVDISASAYLAVPNPPDSA